MVNEENPTDQGESFQENPRDQGESFLFDLQREGSFSHLRDPMRFDDTLSTIQEETSSVSVTNSINIYDRSYSASESSLATGL